MSKPGRWVRLRLTERKSLCVGQIVRVRGDMDEEEFEVTLKPFWIADDQRWVVGLKDVPYNFPLDDVVSVWSDA